MYSALFLAVKYKWILLIFHICMHVHMYALFLFFCWQKARSAIYYIVYDAQFFFVAFRSVQSEGRAIHRVKRNLPKSPRKKRHVIKSLVRELNVNLQEKDERGRKGISEEVKRSVEEFFLQK